MYSQNIVSNFKVPNNYSLLRVFLLREKTLEEIFFQHTTYSRYILPKGDES